MKWREKRRCLVPHESGECGFPSKEVGCHVPLVSRDYTKGRHALVMVFAHMRQALEKSWIVRGLISYHFKDVRAYIQFWFEYNMRFFKLPEKSNMKVERNS